jgi:UDP:flavonoid glycosyltransferase YjiC (YdhE family)
VGDTFPFKKLDERRLIAGLRSVLAPEVAAAAAELASQMAGEDPVAEAVAMIERSPEGVDERGAPPHIGRGL